MQEIVPSYHADRYKKEKKKGQQYKRKLVVRVEKKQRILTKWKSRSNKDSMCEKGK